MAEEEKNSTHLSDEQLKQVSAGWDDDDDDDVAWYIDDNRGRTIGVVGHDFVDYWPCPKCGRPTHQSWFWFFCDKCDSKWTELVRESWPGTEAELKAAGAAN